MSKPKGTPDGVPRRPGNGGKPDSAMGGGSNILKLDDALASVDDFVAAKLGV